MVKTLPHNAGDVGSTPGRGTEILHAMEKLSPHATTTEGRALRGLHATTRESVCHKERYHVTQ